jgi:hypothetical protein
VSYFYNREVREGINKMQALIGPARHCWAASSWASSTIFLPLYDVISKIKF